jgi:hypothetical protein
MKIRLQIVFTVLSLILILPFVAVEAKKEAGRFVDNGDGTITDTQTGLMWETKNAADSVQDLSNPSDADNIYTWTDITDGDHSNPDGTGFTLFLAQLNGAVAETANSEQLGGYSDWRMPTSWELQTIQDCSFGPPCIDPIFGPTALSRYWSSSSRATFPGPDFAWGVDFNSIGVGLNSKNSNLPVRAVRSEQ